MSEQEKTGIVEDAVRTYQTVDAKKLAGLTRNLGQGALALTVTIGAAVVTVKKFNSIMEIGNKLADEAEKVA